MAWKKKLKKNLPPPPPSPEHLMLASIQDSVSSKLKKHATAWCSEIGSLTSLTAPELHASSDVREPILLHQIVYALDYEECAQSKPSYKHLELVFLLSWLFFFQSREAAKGQLQNIF